MLCKGFLMPESHSNSFPEVPSSVYINYINCSISARQQNYAKQVHAIWDNKNTAILKNWMFQGPKYFIAISDRFLISLSISQSPRVFGFLTHTPPNRINIEPTKWGCSRCGCGHLFVLSITVVGPDPS